MNMNYDDILDYQYSFEDAGVTCLRDYFYEILTTLWIRGEGFSSKRAFGDSDWQWQAYYCLAEAGAIKADFDSDWEEWEFSEEEAEKKVLDLIHHIFKGD